MGGATGVRAAYFGRSCGIAQNFEILSYSAWIDGAAVRPLKRGLANIISQRATPDATMKKRPGGTRPSVTINVPCWNWGFPIGKRTSKGSTRTSTPGRTRTLALELESPTQSANRTLLQKIVKLSKNCKNCQKLSAFLFRSCNTTFWPKNLQC